MAIRKSSSSSAPRKVKKVIEVPVVVPEVVVPEIVVEDLPVDSQTDSVITQIKHLRQHTINKMNEVVKEFKTGLDTILLQHRQELKSLSKKRVKRSGESKASFKACKLSPELAEFFGDSVDTEFARPEVTKKIYAYIRENNLYVDPSKKTVMKMDAKLGKLFGAPRFDIISKKPELGTGLSIYNFQKYLKGHVISV